MQRSNIVSMSYTLLESISLSVYSLSLPISYIGTVYGNLTCCLPKLFWLFPFLPRPTLTLTGSSTSTQAKVEIPTIESTNQPFAIVHQSVSVWLSKLLLTHGATISPWTATWTLLFRCWIPHQQAVTSEETATKLCSTIRIWSAWGHGPRSVVQARYKRYNLEFDLWIWPISTV